MYYMIIIVRHSVFKKELFLLFYLFKKKILKQISSINYIFKMIICIHSELIFNSIIKIH